ncbi:MAG: energy transducer TonB [Rhodospirillaceae bacterium]|nr:energy transducer TonB [Rhodospirillaceae bacterium]
MTGNERMAIAIATSLAVHYFFAFGLPAASAPTSDAQPMVIELSHADVDVSLAAPITLEQAAPVEPQQPNAADRRRTALIQYLDQMSETVHMHRMSIGHRRRLIGNATFRITVDARGHFTDIALTQGSGDTTLDADAYRAVREADGLTPRPSLLGHAPMTVVLTVKYQYDW